MPAMVGYLNHWATAAPQAVQISVQALKPTDKPLRNNFCVKFQEKFDVNGFENTLVFTDEATFHFSGTVYRHILRFWGTGNVCVTLEHISVILPIDMLSHLEEAVPDFISQQDSAPPHWKKTYKNVKSGKGPLTPASLLNLVKCFEETRKLEDRAQDGRPCLKEARAPCIAVEMEAIASEAASGTSSAREAARRLGVPPSSLHNILRRLLQLYPYKLQSCHELFPADTAQREAFRSGPSLKRNMILPGFLTSCGEMKLIYHFMVTLTTITVTFRRPLIHVSTHRSHCIPKK
ncbi:uncharacterized protein TNCV_4849641 [Trichonephila clavipes]|nr:uncharacterized protein TNCV_4849641 [Trichonephila clavipes]